MSAPSAQWRLQDAFRAIERHIHHMLGALEALRPLLPFTANNYAALNDEEIKNLDQFILRFTKLQDTVGGRFYPALLDYLEEPYEARPMLDKLNRLEKLGYLSDAENWRQAREIRNSLSHDYPDDPAGNAARINLAIKTAFDLMEAVNLAAAQLASNHPELGIDRLDTGGVANWRR